MEVFYIRSSDGKTKLHCQKWVPEGQPRAILQIVHGMCEYIDRYDDFASRLADLGILVVGDDHLGHGHSVQSSEDYGYFGEKDGWLHMINDIDALRHIMEQQYPGVPYIILGHSFGSFLTRAYLTMKDTSGLSGVIIMGTSGSNPAIGTGMKMTKTLRKLLGSRNRNKLINHIGTGSYNKKIANPVNKYAWLSTDEAISIKAKEDPMFDYLFTLAGYEDLLHTLEYISSDDWYDRVPQDLPILVASGWEDPVGLYGEGPAEVADRLIEAGCNVNMVLYEDMRHEILNEKGKEAVYEDIYGYILDMADGVCDVERAFECSFE